MSREGFKQKIAMYFLLDPDGKNIIPDEISGKVFRQMLEDLGKIFDEESEKKERRNNDYISALEAEIESLKKEKS